VPKVKGKRQADGKINLRDEGTVLRNAVLELQEREKIRDPKWRPKHRIAKR